MTQQERTEEIVSEALTASRKQRITNTRTALNKCVKHLERHGRGNWLAQTELDSALFFLTSFAEANGLKCEWSRT